MKGKRFFTIGAVIGVGAILFSGCLKNEWEECQEDGKTELDAYITKNNIPESKKVDVTDGYIYYLPETEGTGLSPQTGNFIVINYTGKYLDGTIIETTDSTLKSKWDAADVYTDYVYGPAKFQYGYSSTGFNSGIGLMKEGGVSTIIIPTELAFYNCKSVQYAIELINVITEPLAYEKSMMLWYLSENGMDTISNEYNGIYYKELSSTSDTMSVSISDTVLIRFTGKYTYEKDGQLLLKEFDSNMDDKNPLKIVYGGDEVYDGHIKYIPDGFTTALDTMRKGSHAIAVLPYTKAFGTNGLVNSTYGYFIVPQVQTVIYDLYVEDIKRP
jgi:FKBP-type peptidyl-prolyl cis-trans isomerase